MAKKIKLLSLLFLVTTILTSCLKSKEEAIVGNWEYQVLQNVENATEKQIWSFDAASNVKVTVTTADTSYSTKGTYIMSKKSMGLRGYYIQIKDLYVANANVSGFYKINKLKKDILVINRIEKEDGKTDGAFLWSEFIKK
jgi:hypothetical protein